MLVPVTAWSDVVEQLDHGTFDLAAPCASRPYAAPAARALERTVRGVLASVVGLTQASVVMPEPRSSESESGTVTSAVLPLNARAPP